MEACFKTIFLSFCPFFFFFFFFVVNWLCLIPIGLCLEYPIYSFIDLGFLFLIFSDDGLLYTRCICLSGWNTCLSFIISLI